MNGWSVALLGADADVAGGVAVPVARYLLDGAQLTRLVSHDITCLAAMVLLAPGDGALDVTVVSAPGRLTPGGSPDGAACPPAATAAFPVNSTIDVALDPSLPSTRIRDAGAHGPATPLPPSPRAMRARESALNRRSVTTERLGSPIRKRVTCSARRTLVTVCPGG